MNKTQEHEQDMAELTEDEIEQITRKSKFYIVYEKAQCGKIYAHVPL